MNAAASADAHHRRADAMLDFDEGRYPQAEEKLTALVRELETARNDAELCRALIDRATVRRFSNMFEAAVDDLDAAAQAADTLPLLARRSVLLNVRGMRVHVALDRQDLGSARQALAELRELTQGWQADELESQLAFRAGDWLRAAELARTVAQQLETEGWVVRAAPLHVRAAEAYLELGALERAEPEASVAYEALRQSGHVERLANAQRVLARIELAKGGLDPAWTHALAALDGVESLIRHFRLLAGQQAFLADKLRFYDVAFDVGLARGGVDGVVRAWSVAERAKSFYLCQLVANAEVDLFDGVDRARTLRLRALEDELDVAERQSMRGAAGEELEALSREKQRLLDELMRENPRWGGLRVPPAFDLVEVLDGVGHTWTPVSYYWRKHDQDGATLHVFVRVPGDEPGRLGHDWTVGELARLDAARAALRGYVSPGSRLFPGDLARKLFPDELADRLGTSKRLLLSPHDRLSALPLHAADAGRGRLPIDRWPVLYIPTLALLPLRRERPPAGRVLAIGSPTNGFGDPTLTEVDRELEGIRSAWEARSQEQVTCRIVHENESPDAAGVSIRAWANCEYVHVACHGDFPEGRPLDASLRLGTDGVRASEFFAARLSARLISLSACSLGQQERAGLVGDEWVGFYAPLFYAGAEKVLVSIWDAYSRQAAEFMITLHERTAASLPPTEAFSEAAAALRRTPLPLWANWYLAGIPADEEEE